MNDQAVETEAGCPFCPPGNENPHCDKHLLVDIDDSPTEGLYAIGLAGGALYNVEEIGQLITAVGQAAARELIDGTAAPDWISQDPSIQGVYEALVAEGPLDPSDFENPRDVEEVADYLLHQTEYRPHEWWEVLWGLVGCETTSVDEERNAPPSGSWTRYYTEDAQGEAKAVRERIMALTASVAAAVEG